MTSEIGSGVAEGLGVTEGDATVVGVGVGVEDGDGEAA